MWRAGIVVGYLAVLALASTGARYSYLDRDTLIYTPLILHARDPSVLAGDLLQIASHLGFTLFDEFVLAVVRLLRISMEDVLLGIYVFALMAQLMGVKLIAPAYDRAGELNALCSCAVFALGSGLAGPRLYTIEPEAIPRQIGLAFACLALGLWLRRRKRGAIIAGVVGSCAQVLVVPPVTVLVCLADRKLQRVGSTAMALAGLLASLVVALVVANEGGLPDQYLAALRERTPYVFVSLWNPGWLLDTAILAVVTTALANVGLSVRLRRLALLVVIAIVCGTLASFLLLDIGHRAAIPRLQPLRWHLWPVVLAVTIAPAFGLRCFRSRRYFLGGLSLWFGFVLTSTTTISGSIERAVGGQLSSHVAASLLAATAVTVGCSLTGMREGVNAVIFLVVVLALFRFGPPRISAPVPARPMAGLSDWARFETPSHIRRCNVFCVNCFGL